MSKKYKADKEDSRPFLTLKNIFGLIMLVGITGFWLKTCIENTTTNGALEGKTLQARAIVIDKKNYFGNSPVSRQFSYSYRFFIKGKTYEGNTKDPDFRVGDSLTVKYVSAKPEYSEPLN